MEPEWRSGKRLMIYDIYLCLAPTAQDRLFVLKPEPCY